MCKQNVKRNEQKKERTKIERKKKLFKGYDTNNCHKQ